MEVLEELHLVNPPRPSADLLVTVFDAGSLPGSLQLATELRRAGLRTEVYLGPPGNLRKQLQYADRLGIPIALLVGPDERASGEVTIRDMSTGEQRTIPGGSVATEVGKTLGVGEGSPPR